MCIDVCTVWEDAVDVLLLAVEYVKEVGTKTRAVS